MPTIRRVHHIETYILMREVRTRARCGSRSRALTDCVWLVTCPDCRTALDSMLDQIKNEVADRALPTDEETITKQAQVIKDTYGVKL